VESRRRINSAWAMSASPIQLGAITSVRMLELRSWCRTRHQVAQAGA